MSRNSQQPYPVLGDSLSEPIQEQLNSLLREATTVPDRRWKHSKPLPLSRWVDRVVLEERLRRLP